MFATRCRGNRFARGRRPRGRPNPTGGPLSDDPLAALIEGHSGFTEWVAVLRGASATLGGSASAADLPQWLEVEVLGHLAFEEESVFPVLLRTGDPAAARLVGKLLGEHRTIRTEISRVLARLSRRAVFHLDQDPLLGAMANRVADLLLAHAAYEDLHLLPLVEARREEIRAQAEAHRDGGPALPA